MAVDTILEAETVYVVGIEAVRRWQILHFYLNMIRGNVVKVDTTSVSEMFEQMLRINEKMPL